MSENVEYFYKVALENLFFFFYCHTYLRLLYKSLAAWML